MSIRSSGRGEIGYALFLRPQVGQLSYAVPITSNRQVNSDVVVENGQTIIIGGLIINRTINTVEGVPGLKDIIYEDEHILVLIKPCGLVVHPSPGYTSL